MIKVFELGDQESPLTARNAPNAYDIGRLDPAFQLVQRPLQSVDKLVGFVPLDDAP